MKKVLCAVILLALIVWIVSWFRVPEAVATSAAQPWPGGMGGLDAADRLPPQQANAASVKLTQLAKALPPSEAIDEFVAREIARGELTIGEAPALPDLAATRDLLLRETIAWERQKEFDAAETQEIRGTVLTMARALVASALSKARANDATAWEDLHAAWKLGRSLEGHPQMMAQTAALTTSRMVNGVAWKMPLPAPAWLAEVQSRDHVRPLLEAFHYTAASYADSGTQLFPTKFLASSVEHDRAIAQTLAKETRCEVTTPMNKLGTDLSSVWRRAFRYRAEREASANALRVREGKPVETASQCSDGNWTFDGNTLRFSREITTAPPDKPLPLVLRVKP